MKEVEYSLPKLLDRNFWDDGNNPYLHCPKQQQMASPDMAVCRPRESIWSAKMRMNRTFQSAGNSQFSLQEAKHPQDTHLKCEMPWPAHTECLECLNVKLKPHMGTPWLLAEPEPLGSQDNYHLAVTCLSSYLSSTGSPAIEHKPMMMQPVTESNRNILYSTAPWEVWRQGDGGREGAPCAVLSNPTLQTLPPFTSQQPHGVGLSTCTL